MFDEYIHWLFMQIYKLKKDGKEEGESLYTLF